MNERIKELIKQATTIVEPNDPDYRHEIFDKEKFAELIVRECIEVVDGMADPEDSERYFWAIQNASQKIKEYFGVE